MTPTDVFTFIQQVTQDPLARGMEAMLKAYGTEMAGIVTIVLAIYLALLSMKLAMGEPGENPLWGLIKVAPAWWLIVDQAAMFQWVVTFGLYILPTELSNIAGTAMGNGNVKLDGNAFGAVLNDAMIMGGKLLEANGWDPIGAIMVLALMLTAILSIAYAWWIWFKAGLFLVLLFAIAPLPILCGILPQTRGLLLRWIDCVVGFILLKILAVVFVQLLLAAEGLIVAQMIDAGGDVIGQISFIICAMCVFIAFFFAAQDVPRLAGALSGGTVMHSSYGALAFGAGWLSRGAMALHRRNRERAERDDNLATA